MPNELPTDLTPLLPPELVAEVLELLTSQEDFMSKAKESSVGVRGLKMRYDTLQHVWEELQLVRPNEQLAQLRRVARALLQDLKRSDESVTSDLVIQYEHDWKQTEERVRKANEQLSKQEWTWNDEFSVKRRSFVRSLRTRWNELSELREQLNALKSTGELSSEKPPPSYAQPMNNGNGSVSFERGSINGWLESEQSLTAWRESLTRRKQELQNRKEALPLRRQQWLETVELSQQEAAERTRKCAYLKHKRATM